MTTMKDIQKAYNEEVNSKDEFYSTLVTEDINFSPINFKNRLDASKVSNSTKSNLLGSIIRANLKNKNDQQVEALMSERNISNTYESDGGKQIYTSPDIKFKGHEVRFVSTNSNCRDGYANIENIYTLQNFLSIYDYLSKDNEKVFDTFVTDGCKWLYEDRNETIDKNYNWIYQNWLKIKNIYMYTIYSSGSTDMYCDIEVDISKFKGLQDYLSKKSCVIIYIRYNFSSGNFYVGQDILNDRTELWNIKKK